MIWKRNSKKTITVLHPLGQSNHRLLVPGARGATSGPGLFPEAVQKMWRGLNPHASRDYRSAQPRVGRPVPLLSQSSLKLHVCSIVCHLLSLNPFNAAAKPPLGKQH